MENEVELFFENPNVYKSKPNLYSVFYLLRRDISSCLGIDPNNGKKISYQVLWPGLMTIFAGIDLLGKFYAGEDYPNKSGERFKNFIRNCFNGIAEKDIDIIYQIRNSIMHSFGLYSPKSEHYIRIVPTGQEKIVEEINNNLYSVDIINLKNAFEDSIDNYYGKIKKDSELQNNFNKMFSKYGTIHIS